MCCPGRYTFLNEKYRFVERVPFDGTCTGLVLKLEELSDEGYLFRGQRDAFWPIVSSGRRAYARFMSTNPSSAVRYLGFLTKALAFAKKESAFVPQGTRRRKYYDHEIWGWLQHYSYPTPFIDFTKDPLVALFMATYHANADNPDGWFSVYAMLGDYIADDNETVRLEQFIKDYEDQLDDCKLTQEQRFEFEIWNKSDLCLIHKDGSLKPWAKELARNRIASQSGLFAYLGEENESLESFCAHQEQMKHGYDGEGCILRKIKCLDIPNVMVPLVREYCRKEGYTTEHLGLADQSVDDCMKCVAKCFLNTLELETRHL